MLNSVFSNLKLLFSLRGYKITQSKTSDQYFLAENCGCDYYGMRRLFVPSCWESQDDNPSRRNSSVCHLTDKKVDREWSEWEYRANAIDDENSNEIIKTRGISIDFAHGGNPGGNESSIFLGLCRTFHEHCEKVR